MHVGMRFRTPVLSSDSPTVHVSLRNIGEMEELADLGQLDFIEEKGGAQAAVESVKLRQQDDGDGDSDGDSKKKKGGGSSRVKHGRKSFDRRQGTFELTRADPVFLVVDHACQGAGTATITLQVRM